MIEFLSIIKNILFKLNNCFFIVSCDSDRINKMLNQNENNGINQNENYTDKIFYVTINIEILSYFDNKIIYTENPMIKNYLSKLNFKNDFRKIYKAINRANSVILFIKKDESDLNWYFLKFVAFWVYYKNIDLLKSNKNLLNLNLNLIFDKVKNKISNYTKNIFFKKNKDSFEKDEYEFLKIINTTSDCFIRVYNENNNISIPFSFFIPFIKDIDNFDFENLCNVTDIEDSAQYLSNLGNYLGDYLEYKNIYKYLEKNAQELFDEIFSFFYFKFTTLRYIELDISIKKYFEYMQNII
ncbi:hypothetical protein [Spiroplasma citri]|uniref:hypothetical protein n=1 Tax=Spiroplasma citri TaxID=2133 RepID=UPI0013A08F30|nr:hypothetical protein [Spiroplasma citri]QIA67506.1 hypothetical protein GMI18_07640 [Spiroplasma citri]